MLGDVLITSTLLEPIKQRFPDAVIDYLIDKPAMQVMQGNPFVTNYILPEAEFKNNTVAVFKLALKLRKNKYDVIIDVYGKLRSTIIRAICNAKIRVAWKKSGINLFVTHPLERLKMPVNGLSLAIENRLLLLTPILELDTSDFQNAYPKMYVALSEKVAAKKLLEQGGVHLDKPIIMVSILGSNEKKTYPLDYMAVLLKEMIAAQPKTQLLFNYIPSQLEQAQELYKLLPQQAQKNVFFDIYAKNLRSFIAITSHCTAVMGNEGGAINMGKALHIKSFIIFAPYLKKHNWFGMNELKHTAVHLADYIAYKEEDYHMADKDYITYYRKFTPEMMLPTLKKFQSNL